MLNKKAIKKYCHDEGKQVSSEFLQYLESWLSRKLYACCKEHNGGSKRLSPEIAAYVGIK